jgi:hypothetical protein
MIHRVLEIIGKIDRHDAKRAATGEEATGNERQYPNEMSTPHYGTALLMGYVSSVRGSCRVRRVPGRKESPGRKARGFGVARA